MGKGHEAMNETMLLAAVAAVEFLVIFALLWMLHRARVDAVRSIDRLLLLGKSSSPGEAIAAYERLNRIERARDEVMAQRKVGTEVAQNEKRERNWFGFARRPKMPPTTGA